MMFKEIAFSLPPISSKNQRQLLQVDRASTQLKSQGKGARYSEQIREIRAAFHLQVLPWYVAVTSPHQRTPPLGRTGARPNPQQATA